MKVGDNVAKERKKQVTADEKKYWLSPNGIARIRYHRAVLGEKQATIAKELMHISESTLKEWKKGNSALSAALNTTKKAEAARAFEQLDRSAEGGSIAGKVTTKYQYKYDKEGNEVLVAREVTVTEEKAAPNPRAAEFKLKNLDPEHFKDRMENTVTGADGGPVQIETLTADDLDERIKELQAKLGKDK